MKVLLVTWMLVFGFTLSSGHYIRPFQNEDLAPYEVKEEPSGVFIANPKPLRLTLRDILYYHFIERPYEKEPKPQKAITERSFTSSHGYQFADPDDAENDLFQHFSDKSDNEEHLKKRQVGSKKEDDGKYVADENEDPGEPKPLTDEAVKEAYQMKSYLFDQMRQRYLPGSSDDFYLNKRRKRDAQPQFLSDDPEVAGFATPKSYGMSLNHETGYVWNNMHGQPGMYYEIGEETSGDQSLAPYQLAQNPPHLPQTSGENSYQFTPPPEEVITEGPEDNENYEDIFVDFTKPKALALVAEENPGAEQNIPELIYGQSGETTEASPNAEPNPTPSNNDAITIEPVLGPASEVAKEKDNPVSENPAPAENPIEPQPNENEQVKYPIVSTSEPLPENANMEEGKPVSENPAPAENIEEPSNPGPSETSSNDPQIPEDNFTPTESFVESTDKPADGNSPDNGDQKQEMPEAPTLPPMNYDSLPYYIRESISTTEKSTVAPLHPQLDTEDKKDMEDKMEEMLASTPPVEDIPKTYGMNLTSGRGHVWNDLVNPPVSFDVGTPDSKPEEPKSEEPKPEEPKSEEPKPEEPKPEEPKLEEPKPEEPKPEEPKLEEPKPEEPKPEEPKLEEPKPEEPIPEEPKPEEPKPEEPKPEEPKLEELKPEAPIPEEPKPEEPKPEEPKPEEPKLEEPKPEEPIPEEPKPEEPKLEELKPEAPIPEEPKPEEPKPEEPKPEEPKLEELKPEAPIPEEPKPEEPKPEEPKPEEPKLEEPKPEEPIPEEPKPEEPKPEEPKPEEPKLEEPKPEAPIPEEPKPEEPKPEEPKPEEPKLEEPKPEEPIPEEPKPEEPKSEQPIPEDPKPEEPILKEPKPEEPKPEEPILEEPKPELPTPEEPKTEESIPEEPKPEEPKPEEPKSEMPLPEEPLPEEPKPEEPIPEEPKPEIPIPEEPKPEEPIPEEPKLEKPIPEEPKLEEPKPEEPTSEEPIPEEPKPEEPKPEEPKPEEPIPEDPEPAEPKPENKPDIMNELMQSKQFWKWLADWSAAYTQELEQYIKKTVHQEICNHSKRGEDMCPLEEDSEESQPAIRGNDDKIRRSDKGNKVDATTIYGNSVGNEKVTNVFIFNPDNAKQIIDELKPDEDSKVNLAIDYTNKNEKEDKIQVKESKEAEEINESEDAGIQDREKVEEIEQSTDSSEPKDTADIKQVDVEDRISNEKVEEKPNSSEAAPLKEKEIVEKAIAALEE